MDRWWTRATIRVARVLLRLYPAQFRNRFGDDVLQSLREESEARSRCGWSGIRYAFGAWIDLLFTVRRHYVFEPGRRHPVPLRQRFNLSLRAALSDWYSAVRLTLRAPGYSAAVVVTLGLGIGAAGAVFTIVDGLLLNPVPGVDAPHRVFKLYRDPDSASFSYPEFKDLEEGSRDVLQALAVSHPVEASLKAGEIQRRSQALLVNDTYFKVVGVEARLGRVFAPGTATPGRRTAVLSHRIWKDIFAADPAVLGRTILLNEAAYLVIGVLPEAFRGLELTTRPEIWVPVEQVADFRAKMGAETLQRRHWRLFQVFGRLAEESTRAEAAERISALLARLEGFSNEVADGPLLLRPLAETAIPATGRRHVRDYSLMLSALGLLLLLVAATSVANLMAGRATTSVRPAAIRIALGSSRLRLFHQSLVESILPALASGFVGWLLTWQLMPLLRLLRLEGVAPSLVVDHRVFIFALALGATVGLTVGLLFCLRLHRRDLFPALKDLALSNSGIRIRSTLVGLQIALSVVLLATAGLLIRTLLNLHNVDTGFDADNLLTVSFDLDAHGYDKERGWSFLARLGERLGQIPAVTSAAFTSLLPLQPEGSSMSFYLEGGPSELQHNVQQSLVGPGYFATMRIPLRAGREFQPADRSGAAGVVIVNKAMANKYWPGRDPLGEGISVSGPKGPFYRVVGVVEDHHQVSLRQAPGPHLYWSQLQIYRFMSGGPKILVARTKGDPMAVVPVVRSAVQELQPQITLFDVTTMSDRVSSSIGRERQMTVVLGLFSTLVLLLVGIGLYGVNSVTVNRRRHELGIRMALGAGPSEIRRSVVAWSLRIALVAVIPGIVGSVALNRLLASQLFAVRPYDPMTLLAVSGIVAGVSVLAAYLPALRATAINPVRILRQE